MSESIGVCAMLSDGDSLTTTHLAGDEPAVSDGLGSPAKQDEKQLSVLQEGGEKEKDTNHVQEKSSSDSSFKHYLRVFTYCDGMGWFMNAISLFCIIVTGAVLPLMDVVFGKFVNVFNDFASGRLSAAGYRSEVGKYSLYFVYLFLGKFVLTYVWTVLISVSAINTTKRLRVHFVQQTLRQEVSFFDNPSTSIAGQITTNGNLINNGISEKLGVTIQAISSFVTAFIVAFIVQWKLTLIIISIVPVNIVVTIVCVAADTMYEYSIFEIYSKAGSIAEEAFSTIRTAHAFWAFPKLSRRFDNILEEARQIGKKKSLIYAILFPLEFLCVFSAYGLAFWQGMRMYVEGEIKQPGTVVTVIFAVLVAAQSLTQAAPQTIAMSKATAAASDLFAIIDRESAIDSLSGRGEEISNLQGEIKLRGVKFAYPSRPDVPVLDGLDLNVPANKSTALVGASGSGKSTIFGILERWYTVSSGSITLDGKEIDELNLRWLRTRIRLVQQEPTLFTGTIYQNVVDGLTGTDLTDLPDERKRELVQEACKAAYAHDFILDLPDGYETVIGERGASLSGGQKQRIVIARSIISNPTVLLLDEATSALDPKAEKIVQKALNNVSKGRTMIIIAHRLSTIRDADNIVVMSKGAKVEEGTHEELIEKGGAYSRLVKSQDLSGGSGTEKGSEEMGQGEEDDDLADADLTPTNDSGRRILENGVDNDENKSYGIMHGLYLVFKEQPSMWPAIAVICIACLAGGGTYPALAILFSKTMNTFQVVDVSRANFFALMFFIVALANCALYTVLGWYCNVIAQHVMKFYRSEIFDNTLRQDMSFFDDPENSTGALVSRLASEPTSLQELVSMNLALILINIVNLLSSCIVAIVYGWKLGLVLSFGALPWLVGAGYVRIRLEFRFDEDTAARFAKSSGIASEAVMAIRTISSLALERTVIERYRATVDGIAEHAIKSLGWKMLFYSLSQSMSFLAMALGFWYGGKLVSTGEYTTTQFYTVFVAVIFSGEAAALFFQYTTSITKAKTAMNYIFRLRRNRLLFDGEEEGQPGQSEMALGDNLWEKGGIDMGCRDLAFSYPRRPDIKVLRGINLEAQSGKMIALVGASGCGKSTIISLIERFYDPTAGEIRVEGRDIKSYDRRLYRRGIALVQQEPVLYQGSIRENISLGLEQTEPTDEDIVSACQQANIWDFVASLPEGLATHCGAQGLSLSGGQRQRIAISRALLRNPRLLLLDEATSALDTESEKIVKEALDRAASVGGRTTVAVAHRLSTIRDADAIVVFERGRVAEVGSHEELIRRKGVYYEMVLGQSLDREAA